jgi:hypothetical protein
MKISKHLNYVAMGAIKRKMNAKNLRKARLYALNLTVSHNHKNTITAMKKARIERIKIVFLIDSGSVKVVTDPQIEMDIDEILKDSEQLIEWGFKLIELDFGFKNYKITNIEFNEMKVQDYLSNNENLFKALVTAKRMEGSISK